MSGTTFEPPKLVSTKKKPVTQALLPPSWLSLGVRLARPSERKLSGSQCLAICDPYPEGPNLEKFQDLGPLGMDRNFIPQAIRDEV